uniref:UAS domain-containing protein n=1 Tax=Paramoeba aestuarina TaxID=180227 RepID=A0A7S4KS35_9EUKA
MMIRERLIDAGLPTCASREYSEAIAESSRRRKLLMVYIHSDFHCASAFFAAHVLIDPEVIALVGQHFLVWTALVSSPEGFRYFNDARGTLFPFVTVNCRTTGGDCLLQTLQGIMTARRFKEELLDVVAQNASIVTRFRMFSDESKSRGEIRRERMEELDKSTLAVENVQEL